MNGQYLCNRPITVSYAFKKDSKGERHGSAAERLLAAQNPLSQADRPHQLFADAPPPPSAPNPVVSSLGSGLPPPGMPPPGSFPPPVPPPGALPPGIPPAMPRHLCLLGLEDMAPHQQELQEQDILVMDTHILTHFLQVGCFHRDVSDATGTPWPSWLRTPPCGTPRLWGTATTSTTTWNASSWTSSNGHAPPRASIWVSHGSSRSYAPTWYAWTSSTDAPHGYTGPPRPPPYGYQRGPLPPPRPTPRPPVPPRGPLRGPLPQ
uniref:Splicing factor 3b subunit 4 n=1 Tax=Otolemur garnettii TaxID=30611 RepID=H0XI89_OTOGA